MDYFIKTLEETLQLPSIFFYLEIYDDNCGPHQVGFLLKVEISKEIQPANGIDHITEDTAAIY